MPRPSRSSRTVALTVGVLVLDVLASFAVVSVAATRGDLADVVSGSTWLRYEHLRWLLPVLWVALLSLVGAVRPVLVPRLGEQFGAVIRAGVITLAVASAVGLIWRLDLSRGFLATALIGLVAGAIVVRLAVWASLQACHRSGYFTERVLLVGHPASTGPIAAHLGRGGRRGYLVLAEVPPPAHEAGIADLLARAEHRNASMVIITADEDLGRHDVRRLATQLGALGIDVLVTPEIDEFSGPGVEPYPVADIMMLRARGAELSVRQRTAKWVFDRVVAAVLFIVVLPLMVVIAIAVRIDSPGPSIFRQRRVGRHGRSFRMLKFRTMVRDAEERLHRDGLYDEFVANGYKLPPEHDPRITRLGRFLRRTSLDELPQLLNVIAGSMSLVGPRPVVEPELDRYGDLRDAYLSLRPGMTGYWQINGRSDVDFPERAQLDAYYAGNRSMRLDLLILSRTIITVLRRDGAH